MSAAETKASNLHRELSYLLGAYQQLVKDTNSEPVFGKGDVIERTEKALFDNRPLADWEVSPSSAVREVK